MVAAVGQTEKFYLGPFTGLITLRAVLTNDANNRYQVSLGNHQNLIISYASQIVNNFEI